MPHLYCDHPRVLLIDANPHKQSLRATILRNYEVEVHTANSVADATSLWRANFYDLILFAAPENSQEVAEFSAQVRKNKPRQRIGLLVGPPAYVRELGATRKKAAPVTEIPPTPAALDSIEAASPPQWQETVQKLVSDWYVEESTLFDLRKLTGRIAGA